MVNVIWCIHSVWMLSLTLTLYGSWINNVRKSCRSYIQLFNNIWNAWRYLTSNFRKSTKYYVDLRGHKNLMNYRFVLATVGVSCDPYSSAGLTRIPNYPNYWCWKMGTGIPAHTKMAILKRTNCGKCFFSTTRFNRTNPVFKHIVLFVGFSWPEDSICPVLPPITNRCQKPWITTRTGLDSANSGRVMSSKWLPFPQTACPHWGVLTVSVKAGAWSGCSLWSAAFYLQISV